MQPGLIVVIDTKFCNPVLLPLKTNLISSSFGDSTTFRAIVIIKRKSSGNESLKRSMVLETNRYAPINDEHCSVCSFDIIPTHLCFFIFFSENIKRSTSAECGLAEATRAKDVLNVKY